MLFVTRRVLQSKYPTKGLVYSASDVSLDDSDFADQNRTPPSPARPFTLLTVGSLNQPYKGTSVLLDAAARLHRGGSDFRLRIVGARPRRNLQRELAVVAANKKGEIVSRRRGDDALHVLEVFDAAPVYRENNVADLQAADGCW